MGILFNEMSDRCFSFLDKITYLKNAPLVELFFRDPKNKFDTYARASLRKLTLT